MSKAYLSNPTRDNVCDECDREFNRSVLCPLFHNEHGQRLGAPAFVGHLLPLGQCQRSALNHSLNYSKHIDLIEPLHSLDGRHLQSVDDAAHGPHHLPRTEPRWTRPRHRRRQQIRVRLLKCSNGLRNISHDKNKFGL